MFREKVLYFGNKLSIILEFKKQDMWIDTYWKIDKRATLPLSYIDLWVCLIPMFPIHFIWKKHEKH